MVFSSQVRRNTVVWITDLNCFATVDVVFAREGMFSAGFVIPDETFKRTFMTFPAKDLVHLRNIVQYYCPAKIQSAFRLVPN